MFKSDGFDNSQLNKGQQNHQHQHQPHGSHMYPSRGGQQETTGGEEFNTSRFTELIPGGGAPATGNNHGQHHVLADQSSSALIDETTPYSGGGR